MPRPGQGSSLEPDITEGDDVIGAACSCPTATPALTTARPVPKALPRSPLASSDTRMPCSILLQVCAGYALVAARVICALEERLIAFRLLPTQLQHASAGWYASLQHSEAGAHW